MGSPSELVVRLAMGAAGLPEELRRRHAAYLASAQREDGGFAGRRGSSDLYYTSFALRGLAMLGDLNETIAARAAAFLSPRLASPASLPPADFVSLVTSSLQVELATGRDLFSEAGRERQRTVVDFFAPFRRDDGAYAKTERGASSTYQTFLVVLCKQLVGAPLDDAERMIQLVRSRQREDGGFVELDALRASGTNPTAAAIGLLRALDGLDQPIATAAAGFLAAMRTDEGGLRAHARIPFADLLSTFTGLLTLNDMGMTDQIDAEAARAFVRSLEEGAGGFRAGAWDSAPDAEYTFYGLGTWALLVESPNAVDG
jgi:geranylgeranyl transferase type-2 subunit beta